MHQQKKHLLPKPKLDADHCDIKALTLLMLLRIRINALIFFYNYNFSDAFSTKMRIKVLTLNRLIQSFIPDLFKIP